MSGTPNGRRALQFPGWTRQILSSAAPAVGVLICAALLGVTVRAGDPQVQPGPKLDPAVTAVSGPSWLNHLGLRSGESGLGRSGADYGPSPEQHPATTPVVSLPVGRPVTLTGADLYRLNCQACHRAEGTGSPPEIRSVLSAVQGSSLQLVREHLKDRGASGAMAQARAEAERARSDLFNRIRHGGQKMPPLSHLQEPDLAALYAYLTELAGTPDRPPQASVSASWARLGEHVVKGTCHICHDAVGERPTDQARFEGAVPPLDVLLREKPVVDFLTKVRKGAAVTSDDARLHYRGRMPVFAYLRDVDVAAAYTFLVDYPPKR